MKLTLLLSSAILIGIWLKPLSPSIFVIEAPLVTTDALAVLPTATPTPLKSEVIGEIAKVFEPEGTAVVVQAINCFYSESGLRWNAYNDKNSNGTTDGGVAQINSIHKIGDRFDYKENIQVAYKIYKRRGNFSAWYAPGCNGEVASK